MGQQKVVLKNVKWKENFFLKNFLPQMQQIKHLHQTESSTYISSALCMSRPDSFSFFSPYLF